MVAKFHPYPDKHLLTGIKGDPDFCPRASTILWSRLNRSLPQEQFVSKFPFYPTNPFIRSLTISWLVLATNRLAYFLVDFRMVSARGIVKVRFLICTDVAARGIDIAGLPFVIQCAAECPSADSYLWCLLGELGLFLSLFPLFEWLIVQYGGLPLVLLHYLIHVSFQDAVPLSPVSFVSRSACVVSHVGFETRTSQRSVPRTTLPDDIENYIHRIGWSLRDGVVSEGGVVVSQGMESLW